MNILSNHKKQEFNVNSSNMQDKKLQKSHKEELGLTIPKDYFAFFLELLYLKFQKETKMRPTILFL